MVTSVQIVEISVLRYIPELLAWGIGIVLAVLMVRRGGSKAEKLLLAGCSIMLAVQLASPLLHRFVYQLLSERDMSNVTIAQTMGWVSLPISILGLAGLVCLVWAFWIRFFRRRQEASA